MWRTLTHSRAESEVKAKKATDVVITAGKGKKQQMLPFFILKKPLTRQVFYVIIGAASPPLREDYP